VVQTTKSRTNASQHGDHEQPTMSKSAHQHITETELAQHKEQVSLDQADRTHIEAMFETYPELPAEIATEFTDRLRQSQASVEDSGEVTYEEIEHLIREFQNDLRTGEYGTEAYETRVELGRRCAEAGLGLPPLLTAFQSYTAVVGTKLDRSRVEAPSTVEPFQWHRCIERVQTLDERAVTDGHVRANEDTVSRDALTTAIEEIKTRHIKPMEASGTVVERGSDEVCDLIGEQTDRTRQISEDITTLSATVEEVASSAQQVDTVATDAEQKAADGQDAAEDAITVMEEIETESAAVADDIAELEQKITEIDEITAVISDIAEQTNMLALNASIEAARAGEAGDGFAVVADEVKQLAEESQEQATEVEETVADVQAVTTQTVESLQRTNERIDTGLTEVERAMAQLEDIVTSVTEASEGISEIARATDEQAEMAESVSTMVDEVADRAETVQSEIDKIAAANREQTDKIDNVLSAIDDLATVDEGPTEDR
jgi:heme-based aerotactic transducer